MQVQVIKPCSPPASIAKAALASTAVVSAIGMCPSQAVAQREDDDEPSNSRIVLVPGPVMQETATVTVSTLAT
ncbi:MAG: hypothetical protein AB7Q91_00580 [Phycisphaerales bacterium]